MKQRNKEMELNNNPQPCKASPAPVRRQWHPWKTVSMGERQVPWTDGEPFALISPAVLGSVYLQTKKEKVKEKSSYHSHYTDSVFESECYPLAMVKLSQKKIFPLLEEIFSQFRSWLSPTWWSLREGVLMVLVGQAYEALSSHSKRWCPSHLA